MSKFLTILRSVVNNTAENSVKSSLKKLGFNVTNKDAIRHEIKRLDAEAIDLIGDNDAYYANRKACWNLTSLLLGEVK
jgi:hypothetical protein